MSYIYDNSGWFCRAVEDEGPDAWCHDTCYFKTLLPYFKDWDIFVDPARNNRLAVERGHPALENRDHNYWVVGHAYMFWSPSLITLGQGLRTKIDDIIVPSKSLFSNCIFQGHGSACWHARMLGREDMIDPVGGGVHNDTETFTFVDGHGDFYSTEPVRQWFLSTWTYAYTYPPGVTPSEAKWWTMPSYPDRYPYTLYDPLP